MIDTKLKGLVTIGPKQSATSFYASKHALKSLGINIEFCPYEINFRNNPVNYVKSEYFIRNSLNESYDFYILNSGAALLYRPRLLKILIEKTAKTNKPVFMLWRNAKVKFEELRNYLGSIRYQDSIKLIKSTKIHHLANSNQTSLDVSSELEIPSPYCIYNCPIIPKTCDTPTVPRDPPMVINVGSVNERKNPLYFLQVAKIVTDCHPSVQFVWIGGRAPYYVQQAIKDMDLHGKVEFLQYTNDPFVHIRKSSVLFLSSNQEAFGMVLAEAMACYRSAICLENTGAAEVVGDSSYVVSGSDPGDAARKILNIISLPAAKRINFEARKRYEKYFSTEVYAKRLDYRIRQEFEII